MFNQFLQYHDLGLFWLRIVIGIIFIYHAIPKFKNASSMAGMLGMNLPWFPYVLGLVEFVAGLGLILGLYVQLCALAIAVLMIGAIFMKKFKWKVPFSAHDKMGWEFDLILLAGALMLLYTTGGSVFRLF